MWLLNEEQIKKLQGSGVSYPSVNSSCIGCSACVAISSDVFELDDEWLSVVKDNASYKDLGVDDAIAACPVDAIAWENK